MAATRWPQAGEIVRIRDARWRVVRSISYDATAILDVSGSDRTNAGTRARFILPFEPVHRLQRVDAPRLARPAVWRRVARATLARTVPAADSLQTAASARVALLAFQLEPALAVGRGLAARLLIADDVGLGKTIQAALVVAETMARQPDARILIVTPSALRTQWQQELGERFEIHGELLDSAALARQPLITTANPWAIHHVAITSIDFVKRPEVLRALEPLLWDVVIFDEAHGLAGRSDRATAAHAIAERARTVIMLSATPHSGDDDAFARLGAIGNIAGRFPVLLFRRHRAELGIDTRRRTCWLRVGPTNREIAMHEALLAYANRVWRESGPAAAGARLAMGVLLRRACSSAAALARSLERRCAALEETAVPASAQLTLPLFDTLDDEEPAAALAAPGLHDVGVEHAMVDSVLQLARSVTHESKLAALTRLLRRSREPAIVFTEYRDTLAHIAASLDEYATVQLHGGMTVSERTAAINAFAAGRARVLLATDAAGEGLNLHQRCRLVINIELPWTPSRLEQRIGRVERIGQSRTVHAIYLVGANTPEEVTVARLHERLQRLQQSLRSAQPLRPDEMAAAVLQGSVPELGEMLPPRAIPGIVVADLRAQAKREVEHARLVRSLMSASSRGGQLSGPLPAEAARHRSVAKAGSDRSRPVLTCLTPRRGASTPGCYWAFHVSFATTDGDPIWAGLLCLHGVPPPFGPDFRTTLRGALDRRHVHEIVCGQELAMLDSVRTALRLPTALAEQRELAIAEALRTKQARMAVSLAQPGLFDRRAERLAAAQAALLRSALDESAGCLARLRARQSVVCSGTTLAFAALVS